MWARHMELALGLWLGVAPFALRHDPDRAWLWIHDFTVAALVVAVALLAHWHPLRRIHLALLPLASWLVGLGWWSARGTGLEAPPASQSWITVGLLLAIFAIVPSHASRPPDAWRAHRERRAGRL